MSSFNSYLYASGVAEQFLPDEYRLQNHQLTVPASFVLSRMKSGAILSVYADNVWDLSPYLPKCHCRLNFDSWLENAREDNFLFCQIRTEMKKIIFALLYVKTGKSIIKSIEQRHLVLRQFAAIAYRNGCTLQQLFSDVAYMSKVNDSYVAVSYQKALHIKAFLTDCFVIQQQHPLVIPAFSTYQPIEHLTKIAAQLRLQSGKVGPQTKVVPSRLYMALINALTDKLNEFNQNAAALLQWFQRIQQDKAFARMPREFKDYKNNMKSTHIIYKNEIVELATLCVIRKIQNKFQNKNMYLKSNFVENDSILIDECISEEEKEKIYKYLTSYWNKYTETEIIDNVSKGTISAIRKYQVFSTKDIELLNQIIASEVANCTLDELKNIYPNYSYFNYEFYKMKSPEVINDFNTTKDACLSKILKKWYK